MRNFPKVSYSFHKQVSVALDPSRKWETVNVKHIEDANYILLEN